MNILCSFFLPGNQDDPQGNPIPYTRTTRWAKRIDTGAIRYGRWKKHVVQHAWAIGRLKVAELDKNKAYRLDVECFVKLDPDNHADPENIRKGVQDAIFEHTGDQHVVGECSFQHVVKDPGIVVTVSEISEGVSRHAAIIRNAALDRKE